MKCLLSVERLSAKQHVRLVIGHYSKWCTIGFTQHDTINNISQFEKLDRS